MVNKMDEIVKLISAMNEKQERIKEIDELIVERDKLKTETSILRAKIITEVKKYDIISGTNYGWEGRMVNFLLSLGILLMDKKE